MFGLEASVATGVAFVEPGLFVLGYGACSGRGALDLLEPTR
jgi:hypothetical protein